MTEFPQTERPSHPTAPAMRRSSLARRMRRLPLTSILILLFLFIFPAMTADWLAPHDPIRSRILDRLTPPVFFGGSFEYLFGTDRLGRDILSRIMHGATVSLSVSIVGILVGGVLVTVLGLIAGYFRGLADKIIMRLVDITMALPSILLALVLAFAVGTSIQTVII